MDDVVDQENDENYVDTYDQFVGAEVCLPDKLGRKIMAWVTKLVKDNKGNPIGIEHPTFFAYHSLYEVSFSNVQIEKMTENVIVENILSQVYS